MRGLLITLLLLFYSLSILASSVDNIITINQTSSSGKTLFIDKGSNNQIQFDDYGVLLKKFDVNGKSVFKPVAKLKAVKVYGETSIWISFKTFLPEFIKAKEKLILFSESALLQGRTSLKISRTKIVGHQSDIKFQLADSMKEDEYGLSKKEENYGVQKNLSKKEKHYNSDVELIDLEVWEDEVGDKNYKSTAIYKSPYAKEFSDQKRVQTFEKMVVAFVRKYNDPKFTLAGMYYSQKKDTKFDMIKDSVSGGNYYDNYMSNLDKEKEKESKIFKDLQSNGEGWSDEYSDEELGELVYNVGAIRERERRQAIAAKQFNYQLYANWGLNLINNENLSDTQNNTQQSKYDLELGWELYLLKKIKYLNRFSFEISGRRAVDAYTIGNGYNTTSVEYSIAGHINWYPFVKANILERNIIFFSLLFRTGLARLSLSQTNEEGNYQISTIPGFRGGIKYNFSNGYGVRLMAGYENILASRIIREYDQGFLPDRANYLEGKLSIGLSKFY